MKSGIKDFLAAIEGFKSITDQEFDLPKNSEVLMDRDFENLNFQNLQIIHGDFCSSIFKNCTFQKVDFILCKMPGVTFIDCNFQNVRFLNVPPSFSFNGCKFEKVSMTTLSPESIKKVQN